MSKEWQTLAQELAELRKIKEELELENAYLRLQVALAKKAGVK